MPAADSNDVAILQQVFHPSDFTPASETAFAHALKAALLAQADLTILHVSTKETSDWTEFPGVRATLERWGLLPKNSSTGDVAKLGIGVKKIQSRHDDPVESVTAYLKNHNADLIVLATDQSKEQFQWLSKSVAEPIARKSRLMTLFIPKGLNGFVSLKDGSVSLSSILIPVAAVPPPQPALQAAARLARRMNVSSGVFNVLHVGDNASMPQVNLPELPGWTSNVLTKQGDVIDVIVDTATEVKADLVVMTTDGRNGFLDALRGSHSERILRRTPCPLLAIPAGGFISSVM